MSFQCEAGECSAKFEHAQDEDECSSIEVDGHIGCPLLLNAGWRPVVTRVKYIRKGKTRWLFSRSGWFCPEHVKKYIDGES